MSSSVWWEMCCLSGEVRADWSCSHPRFSELSGVRVLCLVSGKSGDDSKIDSALQEENAMSQQWVSVRGRKQKLQTAWAMFPGSEVLGRGCWFNEPVASVHLRRCCHGQETSQALHLSYQTLSKCDVGGSCGRICGIYVHKHLSKWMWMWFWEVIMTWFGIQSQSVPAEMCRSICKPLGIWIITHFQTNCWALPINLIAHALFMLFSVAPTSRRKWEGFRPPEVMCGSSGVLGTRRNKTGKHSSSSPSLKKNKYGCEPANSYKKKKPGSPVSQGICVNKEHIFSAARHVRLRSSASRISFLYQQWPGWFQEGFSQSPGPRRAI